MEISVMTSVAPARLQQVTHALDARSSHNLSSTTLVRRTSKTSLLSCLHRNIYPSLHSQLPNWRLRQICATSSKETDEVELTTGEEKGESSNVGKNYFQEGRSRSSVQYRQSDDGSSSRLNSNAPEKRDSQRRDFNSRNQRRTSSSRRGIEMEGKGGHSSTNRDEFSNPNTSRYSQYDTEGNMHRAPWDQGPAKGAKSNPQGRRSTAPKKKDARGGRENYKGGEQRASMARIVEKLRAIGNGESATTMHFDKSPPATQTSAFLPRPGQAVHSGLDQRWSNSELEQPSDDLKSRFPWVMGEDDEEEDHEKFEKKKRVKSPSVAELTLPESELRRLRTIGLKLEGRLKIGRLGVTPGIVEAIHDRWRTSELAKVKCDAPLSMNMKKAHEDLERLTGGLVIWRAGSVAVVYRGMDYVHPFVREREGKEVLSSDLDEDEEHELFMEADSEEEMESSIEDSFDDTGDQSAEKEFLMKQGQNADLMMMEELLDGLGPRYADWKGRDPVPVDGDLLLNPEFRFKRPLRLLPHGVKPKLNDFEMTQLRRLARPVPPHFVLGRNKGLDGLAAAIVKLWEESEIVKIVVKKGVQNTSNEKMAEELKRLTGGTLLARDKEYIVLSRGKDFLPSAVRTALEERDRMAKEVQEEEERIRLSGRKRAVQVVDTSRIGTLEESMETRAAWEGWQNSDEAREERIAARKAKRAQAMDKIRQKMKLALQKKERAVAELAKIDAKANPTDAPLDKEYLSEAEKYMYRQQGLKHKGYLLLGRRGVFGGTVENMHLHWKHRELVKILVKAPIAETQQIAKMLERESGGILVDIVNTSKGQAIIVYRGKNYQRPSELRPRHLLTKRQALKRSLEVQRMQSLEKHIQILMAEIETMQAGLNKMEEQDELENKAGPQGNLEDFDATDFNLDDLEKSIQVKNFFKAEPLTRKQRQELRQQIPLISGRTANFNIGKTTVYVDLAKSICAYLQKHPFVKVGVKGRPKGSSVASVVEQIEEHTGAVLLSTEPSKLIFYRGWPAGEERPDLAVNKKEGTEDELSSGRRGLSVLNVESEDEDKDDFDDFGIDAWNDEDWEETAEDEEVTHEATVEELHHEDATWS